MSDKETTAAPQARSKLLMFGIPVVVLLLGGAGVGWWYVRDLRAAPASEKAEEKEPTGLVTLDTFTVNLADPGGRRYLRVAMQLVVPDEAMAKTATEDVVVRSRVRSALLELLAQKLSSELITPEGRTELKKSVAETASHIGHLDVRDVLFQEFVVQ